MNIFDKLGFKKLDYGSIQSVDEMTIIPILGDDRTKNTSNPHNIKFNRTTGYGSMVFENTDSAGYGIIPSNTMILSEQRAQDHAMSEVGIVVAGNTTTFKNACCVQSSQGGYLDGSKDNNEYNILPLELRKKLLSTTLRNEEKFSKLWKNIEDWMKGVPNISRGGHLEYFFKPFKKELEDFVAEFEPVENQIGSVILFNEKPVGLEIMPTVSYWNVYWKWIIRGCYGAQLLKLKKANQIQPSKIKLPELTGDVVDTIEKFFDELKTTFLNKLSFAENEVVSKKLKNKEIYQKLIKFGSGGGDLIIEEGTPTYLSAIL
jgi:hypothetical protein